MHSPSFVLVVLVVLVAVILECESRPRFAPVFNALPAAILIYIFSIVLGSIGILPHESIVYDMVGEFGVPFAIFLLTIGTDLTALRGIGRMAMIMSVTCLLGTFLGLYAAFVFLSGMGDSLAWQPITLLSASWIGGSGNMIAAQRTMEMLPSAIGPMVIADAVISSCWFAVLMALAPHQNRIDRVLRAEKSAKPVVQEQPEVDREIPRIETRSMAIVLASGLSATLVSGILGSLLSTKAGFLGPGSWALLIITSVAIALSFTRARSTGKGIGSSLSQATIYVALATIGAKADFGFIADAPLFLGAGFIALFIHVGLGLGVAWLLRIPFAIFVASSAAGIGGVASAPVISRPYGREIAPLALIIALGYYSITNYLCLAFGMTLRSLQH